MNMEFASDVTSMGDDGVDGDIKAVGNFFVEKTLYNANDNIFLTVRQNFTIVLTTFEDHL